MRTLLIAALCLATAWPVRVLAQAATALPTPSAPTRLGLCAACHGRTGHASMPGVPNLAGQKLDYLRDALKQYRDGRRSVPVMRAAVGPLNAAELDDLARWYSAQSAAPQARP
ncbi:MAG: c-type cytochrome [Rhodanobacter sp.]